MKAGDYVRTEDGIIAKITNITMMEIPWLFKDGYIIKSSPNIIDLIQVGDYVNGCPVLHKDNNELVCGLLLRYKEEDIKSIVTKEQFESIEYKIGE